MRIGVDASCWRNQRGYGRFTRELMKATLKLDSKNEYVFFIDGFSSQSCQFPENVKVVVVPTSEAATEAASSAGRRSVKDVVSLTKAVSQNKLNLFFFPSVYSYFPIFSKFKKIVGIHDVIAERFPKLIFPNARRRFFWRLKVWLALKQADAIVTVSQHSKRGIIEIFGLNPDQIEVISEAPELVFQPAKKDEEHDKALRKYNLLNNELFFLYVGGFGPHKNLEALVNAFAIFCERNENLNYKLIMVGNFETDSFWIDTSILQKVKTMLPNGQIQFPGFVPDEDLVHLYSAAEALVMPSFDEGFGLPAIEAMSCATPVIGSQTTSLPEIISDAGLFFDPYNTTELADCLEKIARHQDLKHTLGKRGRGIAQSYTWEKSAQKLLSIFEQVAGS